MHYDINVIYTVKMCKCLSLKTVVHLEMLLLLRLLTRKGIAVEPNELNARY